MPNQHGTDFDLLYLPIALHSISIAIIIVVKLRPGDRARVGPGWLLAKDRAHCRSGWAGMLLPVDPGSGLGGAFGSIASVGVDGSILRICCVLSLLHFSFMFMFIIVYA